MTLILLKDVLLWSTIINYGFLLLWFALFILAHDGMYRLQGRWFRLSVETFDTIHYAGMAAYKLGILLLNLAPWVALHLVS